MGSKILIISSNCIQAKICWKDKTQKKGKNLENHFELVSLNNGGREGDEGSTDGGSLEHATHKTFFESCALCRVADDEILRAVPTRRCRLKCKAPNFFRALRFWHQKKRHPSGIKA